MTGFGFFPLDGPPALRCIEMSQTVTCPFCGNVSSQVFTALPDEELVEGKPITCGPCGEEHVWEITADGVKLVRRPPSANPELPPVLPSPGAGPSS